MTNVDIQLALLMSETCQNLIKVASNNAQGRIATGDATLVKPGPVIYRLTEIENIDFRT